MEDGVWMENRNIIDGGRGSRKESIAYEWISGFV